MIKEGTMVRQITMLNSDLCFKWSGDHHVFDKMAARVLILKIGKIKFG